MDINSLLQAINQLSDNTSSNHEITLEFNTILRNMYEISELGESRYIHYPDEICDIDILCKNLLSHFPDIQLTKHINHIVIDWS